MTVTTTTAAVAVEAGRDGAATAAVPVKAAKRRRRGVLLWFAIGWLTVLVLLAVFAGLLPHGYKNPIGASKQSPFHSWPEFLGTDIQGRSVLTRIAYGARASLTIALTATASGIVVGGLLGLLAAHFRGWVEAVVDIVSDTLLAFPPLILLLALASALEPSLTSITIGLAVLSVPGFTRLTKANAIAQSNREYVTVARAMGARPGRIIFRELLPNTMPIVLSYAVIVMAVLMVAEGSLAFLNVGIPPPTPSWGKMIIDGKDYLDTSPAIVFVPCVVLFLTVFSLNIVGDHLRSRFDVREAKL